MDLLAITVLINYPKFIMTTETHGGIQLKYDEITYTAPGLQDFNKIMKDI